MRPPLPWLFAAALMLSSAGAGAAEPKQATPPTEDITVLGKRPVVTPSTSYWVEDAYTTFPLLGADFAQGLVIWNHPQPWNNIGASFPPVRALEGLAAQGWDIERIQRNSRLAEGFEAKINNVRDIIEQQIVAARNRGYTRIVLAGQEVGGGLALEAAKDADGLYAIIAFAPNSGIVWGNGKRAPIGLPVDDAAGVMLSRTWDEWEHAKTQRLMVLFPAADEQVPHERGPTARDILNKRNDLSFLLVDETAQVYTTEAADTPGFDPYATCLALYLSPTLAVHPGEFHCGTDELPAALAQMGVKPRGGEGWFGYSDRGQVVYVELPTDGHGPLTYGWGAAANGKTRPGSKMLPAKFSSDTVTAELAPDQLLRGVRHGAFLRVTIDLADGTRDAVTLHRVAGNS